MGRVRRQEDTGCNGVAVGELYAGSARSKAVWGVAERGVKGVVGDDFRFSVLMSVYDKENPQFFDQSLESTLINQTLIPDEAVIVKDGPLITGLYEIIDKYTNLFPNKIKIVELKENKGLGEALRVGLEQCTYNLVARMDTDDINDPYRFEKQISFLKANSNVSVLGAHIAEFFGEPENVQFIKKTPVSNKEIKESICKMKNPLAHMSVIFKKEDVLAAGSYMHLLYAEDYYLWARMIISGYRMANIAESLVYVRSGKEMFKRRTNHQYLKSLLFLSKQMKISGIVNSREHFLNQIKSIGFVCMPSRLKEGIYKLFLRN